MSALGGGRAAAQAITEIIDATEDGAGSILDFARSIAVDGAGIAYVTGAGSDNVFKIAPPYGAANATEIIDATGDGAGNGLDLANGIALDAAGNVYVAGSSSNNAFMIATPGTCSTLGTPCTITEIIDATGDGAGNLLSFAVGIAVDAAGNSYVTGESSDNAFKITAPAEAIPTVSEWGLIVMTLLMLAAGTIVLGRRHRPATA